MPSARRQIGARIAACADVPKLAIFWHAAPVRARSNNNVIDKVLSPAAFRPWVIQREARTLDGRDVTIWAYPNGLPPRSWQWSFAPDFVVPFQAAFEYLRYRIKHRGSWVVEIRERSFERVVADGVFPRRSSAVDGLQAMSRLVPTMVLAKIDHEALRAPARVK